MRGSSNSMVHHYNFGIDELVFFDNWKINKPVVLLIHGFGEDYHIWEAQIDYL